jgi:hypothetical protein
MKRLPMRSWGFLRDGLNELNEWEGWIRVGCVVPQGNAPANALAKSPGVEIAIPGLLFGPVHGPVRYPLG